MQNKFLEALQDAHYNGERMILEQGEVKAAIVPIEDLEVLEEIECSEFEKI